MVDRSGGTDWGTVMIWWTWGLIGWSLLASAGLLWLVVMCGVRRRRTGPDRPAVPRTERPAPAEPSAATFPEEPLARPAATVLVPPARRAPEDAEDRPAPDRSTQPLEHLRPFRAGPSGSGGAARSDSLERLLAGARAGHYTLPDPVFRASVGADRLRALELRAPRSFEQADATACLLSDATARRPLDPVALSARIDRSRSEMRIFREALQVVALAAEEGEDAAAAVVGDMSRRIVEEHLRPAHHEVMRRAGRVAARLDRYTDDGFELDTRAIVAASRRVRGAYAALPDLVRRHRAIRDALDLLNVIAGHRPRHDSRNLFAHFEDPLAFSAPGLPYDRTPDAPLPDDDTARLLWLVSDQAAIARPWLPTVVEQDTAWLSAFEAPEGVRRTFRDEAPRTPAAARVR